MRGAASVDESVSQSRRSRAKRRRRSRSGETRVAKKQESSCAATEQSESSQATLFVRDLPGLMHSQDERENVPPKRRLSSVENTVQLQGGSSMQLSLCDDSTAMSDECQSMMHLPSWLPERATATALVADDVSEMERSSIGSVELEGTREQALQNDTQLCAVSDAWSTDRPQDDNMTTGQEVQSGAPSESLCEELRRSLTLMGAREEDDVTEDKQFEMRFDDKKCFADYIDDHTPLLDDGTDAFAGEEWDSAGDYLPPRYGVGLDWEE